MTYAGIKIYFPLGYLDAPYMRAEDIFDTFLDIVEDAIRFNLEYNTNFRNKNIDIFLGEKNKEKVKKKWYGK